MFSPLHFLSSSQVAPSALLVGVHEPSIVVISLAMAVLASIAALQITQVTQRKDGRVSRAVAIGAATFVLGAGIWSMHFLGMLAFRLCTAVKYQAGPTLLSMLPGLAAAFVAVLLLTRHEPSRAQRTVSGVLIGAGIAAMHYSGMAAMAMNAQLHYDPAWFLLSLVVGVALSVLALQVQGGLSRLPWLSTGRASIAGGMVLGLGIAITHYVGMRAALFVGTQDPQWRDPGPPMALALAVALVALLVIGVVASLLGLLHYRRLVRSLRTTETRLQSVINGTVEGIAVLNAECRIYRFNTSAERITGLRAADVIGQRLDTLLARPDAFLSAYLAGAPMPDGTAPIAGVVREVTVRHPDGRLLDLRLSIGRVEVSAEKLYVAFLSDIGEQKRLERSLLEREAQYGALIRHIPGTFFRLAMDEPRTARFVSDQIHSIVGWPAADFISGLRSVRALVHPDDLGQVDALANDAAMSVGRRNFNFECRLQHADGSHRWVSANCEIEVPADGEVAHCDGVMIDITESKLRAAEFEGTVRAISHALVVIEFDVAGRVIHANENFLTITGYRLEDIRGQRHAMFCDPAHVDSPEYREFWNRLRSGEFHIGEYERFGRDGKPLWLQASYHPVMGADGRLLKIVKFASDVTEQRAVQQALREAKERAELAVAARTAFMANMSHEIRTPMNAVIGFTELLMDTPLTPVQRKHLATVRYSAGSLLELLNGVLDSAKLEKGAMELELREFSLRELATQVTDSLRIGAHAKNVELRLDYPATLGEHFHGDALRMRQVLLNLVSNAVKFTESGSVRVSIRQDGEPGADASVPLHIAVHDTGIGIAADRIEAIFQPFAQADASMSRRFGGTGLGITIALQLVELMGGTIRVESELGKGSVFNVHLSLTAVQAPGEAAGDGTEVDATSLAVLVVDDVQQNAELLQIALAAAGHRVRTATSGEAAISTWLGDGFDLVLMDVHMPVMDGRETTRRIRALEAATGRPRTAIMALTASGLEDDKRAAREVGMDGFLTKPVDLDLLRREMARMAESMAAIHATQAGPAATARGAAGIDTVLAEVPSAAGTWAALQRGEIDGRGLDAIDQALRKRGDDILADLLAESISQFDFERAATLLAPLLPTQAATPEGVAA